MSDFNLPNMRAMHWSAGMQPIEESVVRPIEVRMLEGWLDDDMQCKAVHHEENPRCSGDVVAMLLTCIPGGERPVCSATAEYADIMLAKPAVFCVTCASFIRDHWRLRNL
jgi:hypothetical protein